MRTENLTCVSKMRSKEIPLVCNSEKQGWGRESAFEPLMFTASSPFMGWGLKGSGGTMEVPLPVKMWVTIPH